MRRVTWVCDRCGDEYNKFGETQVEDPISCVIRGNVRQADLCEPCAAKLERFLAGEDLERKPDEYIGSVRGKLAISAQPTAPFVEVQTSLAVVQRPTIAPRIKVLEGPSDATAFANHCLNETPGTDDMVVRSPLGLEGK